jgi:hypothetical protein
MAETRKFGRERAQGGAEQFQRGAKGARARLAGARLSVTDGPFAETKELILGFALAKVSSV